MMADQTFRIAFEHHLAGRLQQAEQLYRQILQHNPAHADALHMLGVLGLSVGHLQAGADLIEKALAINPEIPGAWGNLAEAKRLLKQNDDALRYFERAIAEEPNAPETHNNLGILLHDLGRRDEAIESYRRAIALNPNFGEAQNNLASALADRGEHAEAVELYRAAIRNMPGHAQVHNNLGRSLDRLFWREEAEREFRRAIELKPDYVEAISNLGIVQYRTARYEEAQQTLERALKLQPDHAPSQFTIGLLNLTRGNYLEGWKGYARRFDVPSLPRARKFDRPKWHGSPLAGKTILIHHEQGFGDMIQLARYLPLIASRGGSVILEIQPELVELMKSVAGVEQVIPAGATLPLFEVYAPIFDLPAIFETTIETIPRDVPYVKPDPARVEQFKSRFANDRPKIALNWWGKPFPDPGRSIDTVLLQPIVDAANATGAELVSLQKGGSDVPRAPADFRLIDLGDDLHDFADTAAAMSLMDLIITIDSGPAHLAGALAKKTWTLLPLAADWRWHLNRDDSPWYPTMRLFRQTQPGDWKPVIERVATELRNTKFS